MTADRWTQAVRQQVGLGSIVPLGGPRDGAWIAEEAAAAVLRRAVARGVPGVRLDRLRIGPAGTESAGEPVVPPPPGALPPGPLRLDAEFAATAAQPLPVTASRLRTVLAEAAERSGLTVTEVDLRVTELLDTEQPPVPQEAVERGPAPEPPTPGELEAGGPETGRVAAAALAVPGVSRLTGTLGRPVRMWVSERSDRTALPRRHVRVDVAVQADRSPLEVAGAIRTAVTATLPDRPTVAVLVTALD